MFFGDTRPRILDGHPTDRAVTVYTGGNGQQPRAVHFPHGVQRIVNQVEDDLFDLGAIDPYRALRGVVVAVRFGTDALHSVGQQQEYILHHSRRMSVGQVFRVVVSCEAAELIEDPAGAASLLGDLLQMFLEVCRRVLSPVDLDEGGLRSSMDSGQRLADLVGEGARQFVDCMEAGGVRQVGQMQALLPFSALARSDVVGETDKVALSMCGAFRDAELDLDRTAVPVAGSDLATHANDPPIAGFQVTADVMVVLAAVGLGHEHADIAAPHFLGPIAKEPFRCRIHGADDPVGVDGNNAVNGILDDGVGDVDIPEQPFGGRLPGVLVVGQDYPRL